MQKSALFSLALLGLAILPAAAQGPDRVKLLKAARLPEVLPYNRVDILPFQGISVPGDQDRIPWEIEALEKSMNGDLTDAARYDRLGMLYAAVDQAERWEEAT